MWYYSWLMLFAPLLIIFAPYTNISSVTDSGCLSQTISQYLFNVHSNRLTALIYLELFVFELGFLKVLGLIFRFFTWKLIKVLITQLIRRYHKILTFFYNNYELDPYSFILAYIKVFFPFSKQSYNIYMWDGRWNLNSRMGLILDIVKRGGLVSSHDLELLKLLKITPSISENTFGLEKFTLLSGPGNKGKHFVSGTLLKDKSLVSYVTDAKAADEFDPKWYGNKLIIEPFVLTKKSVILSSQVEKFDSTPYKSIYVSYTQLWLNLSLDLDETRLSDHFLEKIGIIDEEIYDFILKVDFIGFEDPDTIKEELIRAIEESYNF